MGSSGSGQGESVDNAPAEKLNAKVVSSATVTDLSRPERGCWRG